MTLSAHSPRPTLRRGIWKRRSLNTKSGSRTEKTPPAKLDFGAGLCAKTGGCQSGGFFQKSSPRTREPSAELGLADLYLWRWGKYTEAEKALTEPPKEGAGPSSRSGSPRHPSFETRPPRPRHSRAREPSSSWIPHSWKRKPSSVSSMSARTRSRRKRNLGERPGDRPAGNPGRPLSGPRAGEAETNRQGRRVVQGCRAASIRPFAEPHFALGQLYEAAARSSGRSSRRSTTRWPWMRPTRTRGGPQSAGGPAGCTAEADVDAGTPSRTEGTLTSDAGTRPPANPSPAPAPPSGSSA